MTCYQPAIHQLLLVAVTSFVLLGCGEKKDTGPTTRPPPATQSQPTPSSVTSAPVQPPLPHETWTAKPPPTIPSDLFAKLNSRIVRMHELPLETAEKLIKQFEEEPSPEGFYIAALNVVFRPPTPAQPGLARQISGPPGPCYELLLRLGKQAYPFIRRALAEFVRAAEPSDQPSADDLLSILVLTTGEEATSQDVAALRSQAATAEQNLFISNLESKMKWIKEQLEWGRSESPPKKGDGK